MHFLVVDQVLIGLLKEESIGHHQWRLYTKLQATGISKCHKLLLHICISVFSNCNAISIYIRNFKIQNWLDHKLRNLIVSNEIELHEYIKAISELIIYYICRTVTAKDPIDGKLRIIYNAKEAISGLKTPIIKNPKVINLLRSFSGAASLNIHIW